MKRKHGPGATRSARKGPDWKKLKAMPDSSIRFTRDAPRTTPADWAQAIAHRGLPVPSLKI
jgi:hypothetical protein